LAKHVDICFEMWHHSLFGVFKMVIFCHSMLIFCWKCKILMGAATPRVPEFSFMQKCWLWHRVAVVIWALNMPLHSLDKSQNALGVEDPCTFYWGGHVSLWTVSTLGQCRIDTPKHDFLKGLNPNPCTSSYAWAFGNGNVSCY